jgi:2-methylisocitrate lyase-like PEP mutase family enzyme
MRRFCEGVSGYKMANLVEQGDTPLLPPDVLHEMGFKIVLYPLTMIKSALAAMETALEALKLGQNPAVLADFSHLREVVGFESYYKAEQKYAGSK